jgi:hypothetical protein
VTQVLEKLGTTESPPRWPSSEDGIKIRVTSLLRETPKVILRGEVLEVRNVDAVVRIARKVRHHDEWDPAVEAYDPYGPAAPQRIND